MRHVLVMHGASGAGKDTIIHELENKGDFWCVPRWTTRPPRPSNNDRYFHVGVDDFKRKENGLILVNEWAGHLYGISPDDIVETAEQGKIPIIKAPVDNLPETQERLPKLVPGCRITAVYIFPGDTSKWLERIATRGWDPNTSERLFHSLREMIGVFKEQSRTEATDRRIVKVVYDGRDTLPKCVDTITSLFAHSSP